MVKVLAATILAASIVFHALCLRYEMQQFPTQAFPTRFDRLTGEMQTLKFREKNGASVMCWGSAHHYEVEDGKLIANLG